MKIIHVNSSDSSGGAAIAAKRLHLAMLNSGITSKMLVLRKNTDIDGIIQWKNKRSFSIYAFLISIATRIQDKIKIIFLPKIIKEYGLFSYIDDGVDISSHTEVVNSDVIYLHWISAGYIGFKGVERILRLGKPVIWFMHDMFPITGGCHYSFDCKRYQQSCGACHCFNVLQEDDISFKQLSRKLKVFSTYKNLTFVAPSRWLTDCARQAKICQGKR